MTALERCREAWQDAGLIFQDGAGDTATAQAPGHTAADRSVTFRQIEGQVLVNSFSDDKDTILEAVGLTVADLFDEPRGATYIYSDGRTVHRSPDKKFRQSGNTKGTALYRVENLPSRPEAHVYVAEGEKDVHSLESIGATAVCAAMGAGKANRFDWSPLAGRDVTIVADDDEPGFKHAAQVAALLADHARSITVVTAKTGKDAADHVAAGYTLGDLQPISLKPAGRRLKVTLGTEVRTRRVEWLIPDWIPQSTLTLLAGREGLGKSTIAVSWAAEQTRQGHAILYVHTEDSREHTVAPRLKAAGADMSKVLFVDVETETSSTGTVTLPFDNDALEHIVQSHKVRFMVLDAATSSMSAELSGKDDRQVRQFLEPLAQMASRQNMVVLGLVHFGKRDGADSGKLILGSIAWSQVARSVLSVAYDEDDEQLILTNTKGNLATGIRSEALRIMSRSVDTEDGPTEVGVVEWLGATTQDARDLLAGDERDDDRSDAESYILGYLEDVGGTAPAAEILKAGRAAGFADGTLKKARSKAGVKSQRTGFGKGSSVSWSIDAPIGAIGSHSRERESMDSMPEPMRSEPPPALTIAPTEPVAVIGGEARQSVLGSLSASFGMTAQVIAQSVPKRHRDQTAVILDAFVTEGIATVDASGKYMKRENVA